MKESEIIKPVETTIETPIIQGDPNIKHEDVSYARLFPYFDVEGKDLANDQIKSRLTFIWDYFKKDHEDLPSILWAIRAMENSLGTPEFGVKRFEKIYRYLKIRGDEDNIRKERESYEKNKIESSL